VSHFVPSFDAWFDPFAERWGRERGVQVFVDHISTAELVPRATAEVAAQQGHDLYFFDTAPSAFEPHVLDLRDVTQEAERRFGPMLPLVRRSVYNPNTRKFFGFSDRWILFPGNYLRGIWSAVGMPAGPGSWEDLLRAGNEIKRRFPEIQIPIGIGFSQDIDSNMATRAILWSFGASIQDANENVVLNSEQTIRAVEYGVRLFREVMNPAVLSWNAASNNQALNARQTSFIINPISAYRTAQANRLPVAEDIFFTPALGGPRARWVPGQAAAWVIWRFARSPDLAKDFLLALLENYRDAVLASRLYNFPSYPGSVADSRTPVAEKPDAGRRWIQAACIRDPFGSNPPDKLRVLADAEQWSTNIGHPGPANPAEGEIFDTYLIPDMFAQAATGRLSVREAVAADPPAVRGDLPEVAAARLGGRRPGPLTGVQKGGARWGDQAGGAGGVSHPRVRGDPRPVQALRGRAGGGRGGPVRPGGRVRGPPRAQRLREDDPHAHDRGPGKAHRGGDLHRGAADRRRRAPPGPGHRHGVPELRPLSPQDRVREHRLPPGGSAGGPADPPPEGGVGRVPVRAGAAAGPKARQLSGGERQRVALARAVVRDPKVFLLDEPLSNLDAKLRAVARFELKQLQRQLGTTTIYVTHDQVEAMGLGDRIAVMDKGRIRQIGKPQEVYDDPADTFVATFLGSPPMNLIEHDESPWWASARSTSCPGRYSVPTRTW
jgi:hypothetical protein